MLCCNWQLVGFVFTLKQNAFKLNRHLALKRAAIFQICYACLCPQNRFPFSEGMLYLFVFASDLSKKRHTLFVSDARVKNCLFIKPGKDSSTSCFLWQSFKIALHTLSKISMQESSRIILSIMFCCYVIVLVAYYNIF